MADGRPIKQVKLKKTQKAHLHPLTVKNLRNPCTGYRVLLRKRNADIRMRAGWTDGRTDIRDDANTPRPQFVGWGIKRDLTQI